MLGGILVSEAVLQKCTADPSARSSQPISKASARPDFELMPAADLVRLDSAFAQGSGSGEIAVLACAAQHCLIVMLDERRARRIAQRLHGCFVSAAGQQDIVIQAGGLVVWKKAKDR